MTSETVNYYQGSVESPYHISVGAVLRNETGEIACHYFNDAGGFKDVYTVMRETMEPGETIEDALHRGLMEEFGAKATIAGYIGSIVSSFAKEGVQVQKTTLYFACDLIEIRPEWRKPDDEEKDSQVQWHPPEFLIPKMQQQARIYGRDDFDETAVILRSHKA